MIRCRVFPSRVLMASGWVSYGDSKVCVNSCVLLCLCDRQHSHCNGCRQPFEAGRKWISFFFILGDGGIVVAIYFQTDLFISCKKKTNKPKNMVFVRALFAVVKSMKPQRLPISKTVTSVFLFFKIPQVNNALFSPLSWLCTALVVINNVGRVLPETVMF